MSNNEPEITQIAKFIAVRVPSEGHSHTDSVNAWRAAIRYARRVGIIDQVITRLKQDCPTDESLHLVLEAAR